MPTKTIYIKSRADLQPGDVVLETPTNIYSNITVQREVPLVLPTTPGTLIKVQRKDGVRGSDVLLRGHDGGIYDYAWHSENNRWPTDTLLQHITDFEVLYAPEPTDTEGGC